MANRGISASVANSWYSLLNYQDMKFSFCLVFGLILLAIGFLLAGQCVMEMDSVKPMFVAFIMILVGALFRSLHYYDKQDLFVLLSK